MHFTDKETEMQRSWARKYWNLGFKPNFGLPVFPLLKISMFYECKGYQRKRRLSWRYCSQLASCPASSTLLSVCSGALCEYLFFSSQTWLDSAKEIKKQVRGKWISPLLSSFFLLVGQRISNHF